MYKKILAIVFIFFYSCSSENYVWYDGSLDDAIELISESKDKLIMLDFYSDGWGACVRLDVETLSDKRVIEFSKQNFISIKLKPYEDKKSGKLFDSLSGNGIPLIVFLNHEGVEVERILGFQSPEEYLKKITDIYSREGTFLNLKERFISGDFSSDVLSKLSEKCKSNPDQELCELVYNQVVLNQETSPQSTTFGANLFFARKDLDFGK